MANRRCQKRDWRAARHTRLVLVVTWSQRSDLNRWPAVYETAALPLSYAGLKHLTNRGCSEQTLIQFYQMSPVSLGE